MPTIRTRNADTDSSFKSNLVLYIVGFCIIGVLLLGLVLWLGTRFYRKRTQAKREKAQGAAFLSVRGIVREGGNLRTDQELPYAHETNIDTKSMFSREQLTRSIVLPERTLQRPNPMSRDEIIDFHRQSGTFPKPFTFALSASGARREFRGSNLSFETRHSFLSISTARSRYSVMSSVSGSSVDSTPTSGTFKKVRQVFNPILPDELLLKPGEKLTVVQSFEDGWCLVGRENSIYSATSKSLFNSSPSSPLDSNIELGCVPAWCFLKPMKGLHTERPVRNTSLGITVQIEQPGAFSRDDVISWSNF